MRVVIVGGAGFIGTALARALLEGGSRPCVLDTAARLARSSGVLADADTAAFDFTTDGHAAELMDGADALVHLACTTHPAHSMSAVAWDAESNIAPSIRLFEAALRAGVGRVVFASSGGTVYGVPERLPVAEDHPTRPLSAYGVSKLAIEGYLSLYPALRGISLRLANPYGPYQLTGTTVGVIARHATLVARDVAPEVWGDGTVVRDFLAIEDAVSAFLAALRLDGLPAGPYNVGSGMGRSIRDVLAALSRAAGTPIHPQYKPGRPYDVPAIVLDPSRFAAMTGWAPRVDFDDGVATLYRSARSLHGRNTETS